MGTGATQFIVHVFIARSDGKFSDGILAFVSRKVAEISNRASVPV